jgi:tetratricopeptide (TPR) repeat protein/GT2 family glycosyltransferase
MKRYFCTYFDRNYFFKAMTMISSLRKHVSEFTLFAICLDEETWTLLEKLAFPDVISVPLSEIEQYDDALLAAKQGRSRVEYYFTLTPTIILRLMERHPEVDVMTYVDSDLFFYSSPNPIFMELGDHCALIHEHRYSPVEAYKEKLYGKFNVGLLCFRNNDIGLSIVKWWRDKCLEWCFNRAEKGKYADQGYLNEFPDRFKDVVVLQHKGAGVALWNHDQYKYNIDVSGKITVDGLPLIFFHFSALQMVFPDFILPDKYGSYPKFAILELNEILIPYVKALFRTIAEIHAMDPEFEYGLKDDVHVTVIHDFLAKDHVIAKIATMNLPHLPIPLHDKWCFYQGKEPSTVTPKSSVDPVDRPVTQIKRNRNAVFKKQGPDYEKNMRAVNALIKIWRHLNDSLDKCMTFPLISVIVSTYNAEKFIRGCLEDLLSQTIAPKLEIIVVDSASQQGEGGIVKSLQRDNPNIRYLRTQKREPVYAAWNRGIKIARGKYITNANTDDRHRHDAFEHMAGVMDARPEIDLIYADVIKTRTPNQTFETCTPTGVLCWPDWDRQRLINEGCFIGPQPMWRRAVHDKYGYFDERFSISGDFEFWLRISQTSRFYHIPTPLGLYLEHDNSIEHRDPGEKRRQDMAIVKKYRIQTKSIQGGTTMLAPETILAKICRLADDDHTDVASWAVDKLIEDYPNHAAVHNNRAVLAYKQGDQAAALNHYERAASLAPENARFQKDLGDFYVILQQPGKALRQFERVLSMKTDDIETLMAAGHLSVSLQRFDDARRYYQRVFEVDPGNEEARAIIEKLGGGKKESIQMATPEDLYAAAQEKADSGLYNEAIALLEQLLAMKQDHATAHNDLGVLYYRQGNKDRTLKHYQQATALAPENAIFQKNLADFHWIEKGDIKAAMELYVRALTLNPRDTEALLCCGRICMQLQKIEDARVFFNSVLENEPWNEDARKLIQHLDVPVHSSVGADQTYRGNVTFQQQVPNKPEQDENQHAIAELEQTVACNPLSSEAYNDLGVRYYQQGEKRKALECYEKAVQIAPDHPVYQKNLADFYLVEEGRIKDALKLYVKVLEANPEDVECMLATGFVCVKMNNLDEARSFYERALEIEPWNADARQALTQLDQLIADATKSVNTYHAAG